MVQLLKVQGAVRTWNDIKHEGVVCCADVDSMHARVHRDLEKLAVALLEMPAAQWTSTLASALRALLMKATAPSKCGRRLAWSASSRQMCRRLNLACKAYWKSGESFRALRVGRTVCTRS